MFHYSGFVDFGYNVFQLLLFEKKTCFKTFAICGGLTNFELNSTGLLTPINMG